MGLINELVLHLKRVLLFWLLQSEFDDTTYAAVVSVIGERKQDPVLLSWAGPVGSFKEHRYRKIPDGLSDLLAKMVANQAGWTPTTAWVYTRLARRIDLRRNRAEITRGELGKLCRLNPKTAEKHLTLLERAGLIAVERRKAAYNRNLPNLYRLCGEFAGVILYGEAEVQESNQSPHPLAPSPTGEGGENGSNRVENISGQEKLSGTDSPMFVNKVNGLGRKFFKTLKSNTQLHDTQATREAAAAETDFPLREPIGEEETPLVIGDEKSGAVYHAPTDGDGLRDEPVPEIAGMMPVLVERLCEKYGVDRVQVVADEVKKRENVKNVPGFVTDALKHGWDAEWKRPHPLTPSPLEQGGGTIQEFGLALMERQHQRWMAKLKQSPYADKYFRDEETAEAGVT